MYTEGYHYLSGHIGFLFRKNPQDVLDEIKLTIDTLQKDFSKSFPINDSLAGRIDKEYALNLTSLPTQYIKESINLSIKYNPHYIEYINRKTDSPRLNLSYNGQAWVNFQKKYEHNPIHRHNGIFSYVIWYQIPYYLENEAKYGSGGVKEAQQNCNGDFYFVFPEAQEIAVRSLNIDKKMEGYIAMFPSDLNHAVYPFYTSDDYRITISGNIYTQG